MSERNLESARHWLSIAIGDLASAEAIASNAVPLPLRIAAEHAHQAAEKAMKAAIALGGRDPQRAHHLIALRRQLPVDIDSSLPRSMTTELVALNDASAASRYPEPNDPPYTAPEVAALLATARLVVDAAAEYLRERGIDVSAISPA